MREVFVDTSAWAAITDSNDANHAAAVKFMQQIARKSHLVITDYLRSSLLANGVTTPTRLIDNQPAAT